MAVIHKCELSRSVVYNNGRTQVLFVVISVMPEDSPTEVVTTPHAVKLVVDVSPSMNGLSSSTGRMKIDDAKAAAKKLVEHLNDTDFISLYDFNGSVRHPLATVAAGRSVRDQAIAKIDSLATDGSTKIGVALAASVREVPGVITRVLLLTDGETYDNPDDSIRAVSAPGAAPVWVVGLGDSYNEEFLQDIARAGAAGSFYMHVSDAGQLEQVFLDELQVLQATGPIREMQMNFAAGAGIVIENAVRVVPDQRDVPIDNGSAGFTHGELDGIYGQTMVLKLAVDTALLGIGDHQIGQYQISYTENGASRIVTEPVMLTVSDDEAQVSVADPEVMRTALRTQATNLATQGDFNRAAALYTQAGMPELGNDLLTRAGGSENDRRDLGTRMTRAARTNKTISS